MVLVLSHPNLFPHYDPWRHSAELVMKGTVPRQGSDPPPPTPGFLRAQRCWTPMRRREHLREELRPRAPGVQSLPAPPPPWWEAASRGLGSGMSCQCCSCAKHCPAWREVSLVIGKLETAASAPTAICRGGQGRAGREGCYLLGPGDRLWRWISAVSWGRRTSCIHGWFWISSKDGRSDGRRAKHHLMRC